MPPADPAPPTTPSAGILEASWSPDALAERGWSGAAKSLWRVLATTWHGILAHRLPQQSAALTYYSLMSLGPLLGLALTVSGFILSRAGEQQDNPAKRAIVAAVEYAAPQIVAKASTPDHHATLREINKEHTVIVVEHDMAFVRALDCKVTCLHEGSVLAEGTLDRVAGDERVIEVYLGR